MKTTQLSMYLHGQMCSLYTRTHTHANTNAHTRKHTHTHMTYVAKDTPGRAVLRSLCIPSVLCPTPTATTTTSFLQALACPDYLKSSFCIVFSSGVRDTLIPPVMRVKRGVKKKGWQVRIGCVMCLCV